VVAHLANALPDAALETVRGAETAMDVNRETFMQYLAAEGFTPEECAAAGEALAHAQQRVAGLVQTVAANRRACRVCGCTDEQGCPPDAAGRSCWWVAWDLCSRCGSST
jgi:hypothetical protein